MARKFQKANSYETTVVLKVELSEEKEKAITAKIEETIKQFEGSIKLHESWGKKRLAYEIKKQNKGHYLYWHYDAFPGVVQELERQLKLNDNVLRFLTIKLALRELKKLNQVAENKKEAAANPSSTHSDKPSRSH
jgi:small subunit ribosomal protein S6